MAGISPTQRTIKCQKDLNRTYGIVERFIQRPGSFGFRKDLFGWIDIISISRAEGIIGVQSCGQGFSEHVKKIKAEPLVITWLESGGKGELWGWRKVKKKRGGKAMIWKARVADIYTDGENIQVIERK